MYSQPENNQSTTEPIRKPTVKEMAQAIIDRCLAKAPHLTPEDLLDPQNSPKGTWDFLEKLDGGPPVIPPDNCNTFNNAETASHSTENSARVVYKTLNRLLQADVSDSLRESEPEFRPKRLDQWVQSDDLYSGVPQDRGDLLAEKMTECLDGADLNRQLAESAHEFFRKNNDMFALTSEDSGNAGPEIQMKIETINEKPVSQDLRRMKPSARDSLEDEIESLREKGIIGPSDSPWQSNVVMVRKKNGKWRMCGDFRDLNAKTKRDQHPLPLGPDLMSAAGGVKCAYISTMDLMHGFHQVQIDEKSQDKTTIIVPGKRPGEPPRKFKYLKMPFGLVNAPAVFQRIMNKALSGCKPRNVFWYLDDILVATETFEEHLRVLQEVFDRLRAAGLKLGPDKCKFLQSEADFLGCTLNQYGIRPMDKKVQEILRYPTPNSLTKVKGILGKMGYYRQFIPDMAKLAAPLYRLRRGSEFLWTDECEEALAALIEAFKHPATLTFPEGGKPFKIESRVDGKAICARYSQLKDGEYQVNGYCSRTLRGAELNYSEPEQSLLAYRWAIDYLRHYVLGQKVIVPMQESTWESILFLWRHGNRRITKWISALKEYKVEVQLNNGKIIDISTLTESSQLMTLIKCDDRTATQQPQFCAHVYGVDDGGHEQWTGELLERVMTMASEVREELDDWEADLPDVADTASNNA